MKKETYYFIGLIVFIIISILSSCKKNFLDAKPNSSIVVPSTLSDFQKMLDYSIVNRTSALGLLSCDDYYISNGTAWSSLTATQRNAYIWSKDVFGGEVQRNDWIYPYRSVFYANSVLNALRSFQIDVKNHAEYNNVKGQALFIRAFNFFDLAINFALPYDEATVSSNVGIPLRLSPNVDKLEQRSTLQQTYRQIIADLTACIPLLDQSIPARYRNRASKPAAYAFASRLYLSMRDYSKAEIYADSCLFLYNKLIDYNTINKTSNSPFSNINEEVIMNSLMAPVDYTVTWYNSAVNMSVDSNLFRSYHSNDLRKVIYFNTNATTKLTKIKRGYSNNATFPFVGLAIDELYLIKAECLARKNNVPDALIYLNTLLNKRFITGTYEPYTAVSAQDALSKILIERRKELIWRSGLRWDDIRRLNKEGAGITLTRNLNGQIYSLEPNSPKYVFPIPDDEVALSGISQNIR